MTYDKPVNPNYSRILLVIFVTMTLLSFWRRFPTNDDAWFAEQSYWLQKEGIIRAEFFRGLLGWENQLLVSHKLFLLYGAFLMKIFGWHLPVVQFVGFTFLCVLVVQLVSYVNDTEPKKWSWYVTAILILFFSNRVIVRMGFENRPELMLAALGFGSFLCLRQHNTLLRSGIAGVLAGMAMLSHLNGVIYLIAGAGLLLYSRKYKQFFAFSIAGGITGLLYFVDIIQAKDGFAIWQHQFRNDPATQNAFGLSAKLLEMLRFPNIFFESPEQAALSGLLVFMLWHQRRFIRQVSQPLRVYFVILLASFWILTKSSAGNYLPLFMPFMFVFVYELYRLQPFRNRWLTLVTAAYFVIGIYGTMEFIYRNLTEPYLPVAYRNLRPHIQPAKTGFVPITFFFNEYEQFGRLLCSENFGSQAVSSPDPTAKMADWAYARKVEFILMDYQYRPEYFYPKPGTKTIPHYTLTYFDGRFAVYKQS